MKSSNTPLRPLILAGTVFTLLAGMPALAGDFTMTLLTGDADSGINAGLNYTAKADYTGDGTRVVNGVSFTDTAATGTNYALTGALLDFTGRASNLTGGVNGLVSDFKHTGGTGDAVLTLSGLTVGTQYVTTLYNQSFGSANARYFDITPSDTNVPFRINQDATRSGDGTVIRYAFTATADTITYTFDAVSNNDSFHNYAMTNAVRNDALLSYKHFAPITPVITQFAGQDAPFTVSNTDLLQTSVSNVTTIGNFNREPILGTVSSLTNGAFALGVGNNRPELVTGENNASITFTLNTTVNPLGYDISQIAGYGGWGDQGRDNQFYSIFFSTVGSDAFTYLGGVNDRPTAPVSLSTVKAMFDNVNLTGVDAIRIDFLDGQENGYTGYGEFDVIGSATVPEPGTAASLMGGLCVLLGLRRRRASH